MKSENSNFVRRFKFHNNPKTFFIQIWEKLTRPSRQLMTPEDVRKAKMLSSLLITMLFLVFILTLFDLAYFLTNSNEIASVLFYIVLLEVIMSLLLFIAYFLSRSQFYKISAFMVILSLEGLAYLNYIMGVDLLSKIIFFAFPLTFLFLITNLLFSQRSLFILMNLNIVLLISLPLILNFSGYPILILTAYFVAIFSLIHINNIYWIQDLKKAKLTAEAANLAKNEFLAKVSHELRTPLTIMSGVIDSFVEGSITTEKEKAKYHVMLKKSKDWLLLLIDDILDFSKLEIEEIQLHITNFQLEDLFSSVISDFQPLAKIKNLILSLDIAPDVPAQVAGDSRRLKQILNNLISNAIKYTNQGQITIQMDIVRYMDKSVLLQGIVKDTGIGIPLNQIFAIFDSFTQVHSMNSSIHYGGTGLGLAITQQLVKLMNGTIRAESQVGQGSKFIFTINLQLSYDDIFLSSPLLEEHIPYYNAPLKILCVDDFVDNREIFKLFLKNTPYRIDEASNGRVAVQKIKTHHYDMVFMDLRMPVMDGLSAVREIREWETTLKKAPTPIIALSAYGIESEIQKSLKVGCNNHLIKPFKKEDLLMTISKLFQEKNNKTLILTE